MSASREMTAPLSISGMRSGKSLTELVMVLTIIGITIGCGWICQGWLLGVPKSEFASATAFTNRPGIYAVVMSPNQEYCVSVGLEGILRTHQLSTHSCVDEIETFGLGARCLAYSSDGKHLLMGSTTGEFQIWRLGTNENSSRRAKAHSEEIVSCAFHPTKNDFVTGSWNGNFTCWNTETLTQVWTVDNPTGPVESIGFSNDGKWLVTGDLEGFVRVWEAGTGVMQAESQLSPKQSYPMGHRIVGVKFLPDADEILVANVMGEIEIWDRVSLQRRRQFQTSGEKLRSLHLSSDGQSVFTGSAEGMISHWDVASGSRQKTWPAHCSAVLGVAATADNTCIASVGWDGQIKFWDL